jgi:hypothetical protein
MQPQPSHGTALNNSISEPGSDPPQADACSEAVQAWNGWQLQDKQRNTGITTYNKIQTIINVSGDHWSPLSTQPWCTSSMPSSPTVENWQHQHIMASRHTTPSKRLPAAGHKCHKYEARPGSLLRMLHQIIVTANQLVSSTVRYSDCTLLQQQQHAGETVRWTTSELWPRLQQIPQGDNPCQVQST